MAVVELVSSDEPRSVGGLGLGKLVNYILHPWSGMDPMTMVQSLSKEMSYSVHMGPPRRSP